MNKTVSIIVPVYNGEAHLRRCVESILNQDYPELELILVDDGSRDASYALMQDYARRDSRVRAVHKENGGVSSTRNRGLALAQGDYIQFADVDDWLPMDATKLLVREMEARPVELVIGDFYRVVEDKVSRKGSLPAEGVLSRQDYADAMLRGSADLYYGVLWNKLYRREIIAREGLRMDETISYSEDMIFNLEYLMHVQHIAVLKAPVYYYQYTKGSLVDQSLNLSSTVKMKASVIGVYTEFYRNTFQGLDYQERLPVIYSYLLSVSHDSLSLPFLPGTKKLGTETGRAPLLDEARELSPLQPVYLRLRLLERYLDTLAKQRGLEHNEMLVLYWMSKLDRPCSVEELAALCALSRGAVILALARLLGEGLASHDGLTAGGGRGSYSFQAPELLEPFKQMECDFDAVCTEGLGEEELALCRRCEAQISANIRRRLLSE